MWDDRVLWRRKSAANGPNNIVMIGIQHGREATVYSCKVRSFITFRRFFAGKMPDAHD